MLSACIYWSSVFCLFESLILTLRTLSPDRERLGPGDIATDSICHRRFRRCLCLPGFSNAAVLYLSPKIHGRFKPAAAHAHKRWQRSGENCSEMIVVSKIGQNEVLERMGSPKGDGTKYIEMDQNEVLEWWQ
ncbi:hypothetical protein KSP39_PZI017105 [Platanthera zijinensis]|uniref:Uncharacterized protein n=1 Tax=Platanthera zijinensis TaxID=2320716 RepID=A0AAP0FZI5_9ASPA